MAKENKILLIDGQFDIDDAKKILITLLDNKIMYHKDEIFRMKEMNTGDISHSEKRLNALSKSRTKLLKILDKAKEKHLCLKIHSEINISLIE